MTLQIIIPVQVVLVANSNWMHGPSAMRAGFLKRHMTIAVDHHNYRGLQGYFRYRLPVLASAPLATGQT
jgi:hypothetical protein